MNSEFLLLTRRDYVAFRAIYRFLFLVVYNLYLFVENFYAFLRCGDS